MGTAGKEHYLDAVTVYGTGRVALSHEYGITSVIGYKEVLAANTALEHALNELALLHETELIVLLLEETVLDKIQNYVKAHAAHGMSLEFKLIIQTLNAYGTILIVTEPVGNEVRHGSAVETDSPFERSTHIEKNLFCLRRYKNKTETCAAGLRF
jgi:hypothetical protein